MDNTQNPGQFMTPAGGGGSAIQAAIQRRQSGMSGGVTNQQGPSAPNPSQAVLPSTPSSMAPTTDPHAQNAGKILGAMASYLQTISKIQSPNGGY